MRSIDVDEDTYQKLAVTARLMNRPVGEVVSLLVQRLVSEEPDRPTRPQAMPPKDEGTTQHVTNAVAGWLPVYKVYKSHLVEGEFNPATMELRVATEPLSGRVFPSPTAAACEVVECFGGDNRQTSNTNGRKFWRLTGRGDDLRSIVGTRF